MLSGFFSLEFILNLGSAVKHLILDAVSGNPECITLFTEKIERDSSDLLSYHTALLDLNSLFLCLSGTKTVIKDDTKIIKSPTGKMIETSEKMTMDETLQVSERILSLKRACDEIGANFLYCAAPSKEQFEQNPSYAPNYQEHNYLQFLSCLSSCRIPYLDIEQYFRTCNTDLEQLYYKTDHHWCSKSGFLAYQAICETLNQAYGFEFDQNYTDINNYQVKTYKNWFLGSLGKKVGRFFLLDGADDFDLIIPLFHTDLTEERPSKNQFRTGTFENTVLFLDNLKKDYYHLNTYATYCGGDFRLQIIKNNLLPNGKRILLIRDSYACVVAPFLSLQTSELHICDIRDYDGFIGDKIDIVEYLHEIQPDYVLVLYKCVTTLEESSGRFNFIHK